MVYSNKYLGVHLEDLSFCYFHCLNGTRMQETTQSLNLKCFQGFEILPIFLGLEVGKYGKNTLVFPVDAEPETLSGTTRSLST